MSVIRIVSNLAVTSVAQAQTFYVDLCNLDVVMDIGWFTTLASGNAAPAHISLATAGGSGTAVPDLSIEGDNVDAVYRRAQVLRERSLGKASQHPIP